MIHVVKNGELYQKINRDPIEKNNLFWVKLRIGPLGVTLFLSTIGAIFLARAWIQMRIHTRRRNERRKKRQDAKFAANVNAGLGIGRTRSQMTKSQKTMSIVDSEDGRSRGRIAFEVGSPMPERRGSRGREPTSPLSPGLTAIEERPTVGHSMTMGMPDLDAIAAGAESPSGAESPKFAIEDAEPLPPPPVGANPAPPEGPRPQSPGSSMPESRGSSAPEKKSRKEGRSKKGGSSTAGSETPSSRVKAKGE